MFLRLLTAMVIGFTIGLDRELKRRGAGIRTHVLVCIGAALVMMTSQYILVQFPEANADMNRLGAQVISGVGFLGVGTIIVTGKNQVRGLTTAAGLWACACAGLAVGIGFVEGALMAVVMMMVSLRGLKIFERHVRRYARNFTLYVEFEHTENIPRLISFLRAGNLRFSNFSMESSQIAGKGPSATMYIELSRTMLKNDLLEEIQKLDGIRYAEEF